MEYTRLMKILIVEDDAGIAEMLKGGFTAETHAVDVAPDGAEGSFLGKNYAYDAIILDNSLPKKDGLTVCKEIRTAGKTAPIIFLSVNDDVDVKVSAFSNGADDYMTKPFSFRELSARLRALMRRAPVAREPIVKIDDLMLDSDAHVVIRGGTPVHLTKKEFGVLEYLMNHQNIVVSRTLIMEHVWTADTDLLSNTIETHIRNIRKKINVGSKKDLIVNIPGRGYMISAN